MLFSYSYAGETVREEGTKVDAGGLGNEHAKDLLKTTPRDSEGGPVSEEINGSVVRRSGTNVCHKPVCIYCGFVICKVLSFFVVCLIE